MNFKSAIAVKDLKNGSRRSLAAIGGMWRIKYEIEFFSRR